MEWSLQNVVLRHTPNTCRTFKLWSIARARSRSLTSSSWIGGIARPPATKKQPWRIPAKARAIARARSRALKIYWQIGGMARPPAKPKTLPWLVRCWGRTPFVSIHRSEPRTQLWSPRSASVHFSCVLVFVLEFPQSHESFESDQFCLPLQEIGPYIISILWACRSAEHKNIKT